MILAASFVAFFGWLMLIPEFVIVTLQWEFTKEKTCSTVKAWLITVLFACAAFTCFAPKEEGSFALWAMGYGFGSLIALSVSFAIIHSLHSRKDSVANRHSKRNT